MQIRWGILGTGKIARSFARGLARSRTGVLHAVGSRSREAAERFAAEHGAERAYEGYAAVLDAAAVDAVYIALPHPLHAEWATRAAAAGKHILCEKPLAMNAAEAAAVVEAARRHDVFLMEAFMYRCHPQMARLAELVRAEAIGEVRMIASSFSYNIGPNPANYILTHELGGGGILDVGCYPVSAARLVAGAALGRPFAEPVAVCGTGVVGARSRVDEYAVATFAFPGNILAQLATGVQVEQEHALRVYGSRGRLELPNPWLPGVLGPARLILTRDGHGQEELAADSPDDLYAIEADTVAAHLDARQAPAMRWDDTLGNMRALDAWRAAIGLRYDWEPPPPPILAPKAGDSSHPQPD